MIRFFYKHDSRSDCHVSTNSDLCSLVPSTGACHLSTLNLNFLKGEN